jgi:formylglycine-generating enzyme required for sulfatase activity
MSRIFISHSSNDNAVAMAVCQWLAEEGWIDVFLDLDPERGIKAGELWEEELRKAANRCEAVIFLVSRAWLGSEWCRDEFRLARHLRKRLFGVLIENIAPRDLPPLMTREWQLANVAAGGETKTIPVVLPGTSSSIGVTFGAEGLHRLKIGLLAAGLDPRFFHWPPANDPDRPPYRGLLPLEAEDAGIFFGRDAPIAEALDRLRALRDTAAPRLMVVLGASGSGKSSFLRAGVLPRLARDDRNFLPIPILRPGRAAINGETGLLRSLEAALQAGGLPHARSDLRAAVAGGAKELKPLLARLVAATRHAVASDEQDFKPPLVVLPIDQGEELFAAEVGAEADALLELLRDLLAADNPAMLALVTMRSDTYEQLQTAKPLEGIHQETFSLPPMPHGAYQAVIEGPVERLRNTSRALTIDPALTQALLSDIESGGGRDALPLLAFTIEWLYLEYRGRSRLTLDGYEQLGRMQGSIKAAIERAFADADADPRIPRDRAARLLLLRRGLIPWLAGIDPETGSPRRRIARLSEIPAEARPLIQCLVEQRLLATDVAQDTGEATIEPAHEALLRQWGILRQWLAEDAGLLGVLEGVKRASRDWAANAQDPAWLTHTRSRLHAAERLQERLDLAASLEPTDWQYLAECRKREKALTKTKHRVQALVGVLVAVLVAGLLAWWKEPWLKERAYQLIYVHPLSGQAERGLMPGDPPFKECADCPEMIVVPAGNFTMGSLPTQSIKNESPPHEVAIARPIAIARFEVSFEEWDVCATYGDCNPSISASGWGRGRQPVINITWDDAKQYVKWLSRVTGRNYRLLTEAEWEYVARAGTTTLYSFGNDESPLERYAWYAGNSNDRTHPVGQKRPNPFGLHDMYGNVWEWVEDCYHDDYRGAPSDGVAWSSSNCRRRVIRGGSWLYQSRSLRSATRDAWTFDESRDDIGVRVARTLSP